MVPYVVSLQTSDLQGPEHTNHLLGRTGTPFIYLLRPTAKPSIILDEVEIIHHPAKSHSESKPRGRHARGALTAHTVPKS